ncbi:hypothetical protein [Roseovarius sp. MMSF_3281]|uniref:hypothetical protein n=1 Tax=Roseovarius sp. MMSF_3281 TaxID=3046694 RepID=UPI00273D7210|nr:hypothetical protein [Roseovarius sp. MMSF_3281]
MTDKAKHDSTLDAAFAAARAQQPEPSAELMARVLAEAEDVQAGLARPPERSRPKRGYLRQFLDAMGGWPAMTGLAAAGVAGVWLGISPVVGVSDALVNYLGTGDTLGYAVDVMPGAELGLAWEEGAL